MSDVFYGRKKRPNEYARALQRIALTETKRAKRTGPTAGNAAHDACRKPAEGHAIWLTFQ